LKNIGWNLLIKGIFIPAGKKLTIYKSEDFNGKKMEITETTLNLSGK
jgi:hypothetical protein